MSRELINAKINYVSYVDKAANKKQFFLTKSNEQPNIQKHVELFINKVDSKQLVYGLVYEPDVEDAHGDFMKAEEIEKAAHQFMKDARNIDKQHDFNAGVGEVVESYIAPVDFSIGDQVITKGSWVMATKASDEIWESIQKGEITGYSMAGIAEVVEQSEGDTYTTKDEKGFFKLIKEFFAKGNVRDSYEKGKPTQNVRSALNVFENEIWNSHTYNSIDFQKIHDAIADFQSIIYEIEGSGTEAALKAFKKEGDVEDMNKEELEQIIKSAIGPVSERLDSIEKELTEEEKKKITEVEDKKKENEIKKEDMVEIIKSTIEKSVESINSRLKKVEKARGTSNQVVDEQIEKEKGSIWDGLL
ncbi:phage portal protein [Listeria monocytogenes]|nr:phage portal protein [Listeria monocytogenes]EJN6816690.1 phage portal protein [Listeria monocytogenes]